MAGKNKVKRSDIKKAALCVLESFGKKSASIDITFLGDVGIKKMNKKYMSRNRTTDVLSFLLPAPPSQNKGTIIGDIYISEDTARRNAKRFNTGFEKELILYTIHGVLHLLGFDDKTAGERIKIRKLEEEFLEKLIT